MRYRHLRRTSIGVLATLAFLLLMALLIAEVLTSRPVQRLATAWVEAWARDVAGVRLEVDELRWGLFPPRLALDGVVLEAEGLTVEVDRLWVEPTRVRVLEQELELGSLVADGVRLRADGSRLERSQSRQRFGVSIRHLDLRRVEIQGSEIGGSLSAALGGLRMGWTASGRELRGFVDVERLQLGARGIEDVTCSVQTRFVVGDTVRIPRFSVAGPGVDLRGSAEIGPEWRIRAQAVGEVELQEVDRVVRTHDLLSGTCAVEADLDTGADVPLSGDVSARRVNVAMFELQDLRGRLELSGDGLRGRLDRAILRGGELKGHYTLRGLRGPYLHRAAVQWTGGSVEGFLEDIGVPAAGLSAVTELDGWVEWRGRGIKAGAGEATAALTPGPGAIPASGGLDVSLTPEGLRFSAPELQVGRSLVAWEGPLTIGDWVPSWSIRAAPARVDEMIRLVNGWLGSEVLPPLEGGGDMHVTLAGPLSRPRVFLRLDAEDVRYSVIELDRLSTEMVIDHQALRLGPTAFRLGRGGGEVEGSVALGRAPGADQLDLTVRGRRLPLAAVAGWLGVPGAGTGEVSFTGVLHGPVGLPHGSWALGMTDVRRGDLVIGDGSASLDLADGTFDLRGAAFTGGLEGGATWDVGGRVVGGECRWPGMPLAPLGENVVRLFGDRADVEGELIWPLDGVLGGRFVGRCPGGLVSAEASSDAIRLAVDLQEVARAEVELQRDDDGSLRGDGELEVVSTQRMLDRVIPGTGLPLEGRLGMKLDCRWPSGGEAILEGRLDSVDLTLGERPVRLLEPARVRVSGAGVELSGLALGSLEDQVSVSGAVSGDGDLSGRVAGTLDALLLRLLMAEWEPAGRLTGEVELLGTVSEPRMEGMLEVTGGSFRFPGSRSVVSAVDGTALFSARDIMLEGLDFRLMQGTGRCGGRVSLGAEGVELDLRGTVEGLEFPLFPGLAPELRGSWSLGGPVVDLELSGDLEVERAVLRSKQGLATVLMEWLDQPSAPSGTDILRLDLRVEADQTLRAQNSMLNLIGSALLDVTGTPARPGLVGRVEFLEGGEVTFQGVRYELDRATIAFSDPDRIDPWVEMQARAWVQNYQITLTLLGTFDRLVPTLVSDPPLPEHQIVSLLAVGLRDQGSGGSAMGVNLASSLLTQQINQELDRRARTLLPVDQIRLDPFTEATTGNPAARVTVVKQMSSSWTLILESNLSSNREEVILSRWQLAPQLFLEAERDVDGSYSLDIKLRRRY